MTLRVPKAEIAAGLSESMIERFGVVPEPVVVGRVVPPEREQGEV